MISNWLKRVAVFKALEKHRALDTTREIIDDPSKVMRTYILFTIRRYLIGGLLVILLVLALLFLLGFTAVFGETYITAQVLFFIFLLPIIILAHLAWRAWKKIDEIINHAVDRLKSHVGDKRIYDV